MKNIKDRETMGTNRYIVGLELALLGMTTYIFRCKIRYLQYLALALTVVAIILFILGGRKGKHLLYYLCAITNTISTALLMNIYYMAKRVHIDGYKIIFVILLGFMLYLIFANIKRQRKVIKGLVLIFFIVSVVTLIAAWIRCEDKFLYSFAFFILFFISILLFVRDRGDTKKKEEKLFAIGHFFVFFVVVIIIAIILSEGEAIGSFAEGAVISGTDKKQKRKRIKK